MGLFDFMKSDEQKINSRIPAAYAKLQHLLAITGKQEGPMAALRSLAKDALVVKSARVRGMLGDEYGINFKRSSEDLELTWWADRAVYQSMVDCGVIQGGPPKIPGLWAEEMEDFINWYGPNDNESPQLL